MHPLKIQTLSTSERITCFEKYKLPKAPRTLTPPGISTLGKYDDLEEEGDDFKPQRKEAFGVVMGETIAAIPQDMSLASENAVQYSTFYAQIIANSEAPDKKNNIRKWYEVYSTCLADMGWNLQGWQFQRRTSNKSKMKLDYMALRLMAVAAGPGQLGMQIMQTIKAGLEGLADDEKALDLFDIASTNNTTGGFQMVPSRETVNGTPEIVISANYCSTKISKGKVLFVEWDSSHIDYWADAQKLTLVTEVYMEVKDKIKEELKGYLNTNFRRKYKLPKPPTKKQ
jgi:hypothetical protein